MIMNRSKFLLSVLFLSSKETILEDSYFLNPSFLLGLFSDLISTFPMIYRYPDLILFPLLFPKFPEAFL